VSLEQFGKDLANVVMPPDITPENKEKVEGLWTNLATVIDEHVGSAENRTTTYWLVLSHDKVVYDPNQNTLTPSLITATAWMRKGEEDPFQAPVYWKLNGGDWSDDTSTSKEIAISPTDTNIAIMISRDQDHVLDQESIPVLDSASNKYTIDLSNNAVLLSADSNGVVSSYDEATSVVKVYLGARSVTENIYMVVSNSISITYNGVPYISETIVPSGGTIQVTRMSTTDKNALVSVFLASDPDIQTTFNVAKPTDGRDGQATDIVLSQIQSDANAIVFNPNDDTYSPSVIHLSAWNLSGQSGVPASVQWKIGDNPWTIEYSPTYDLQVGTGGITTSTTVQISVDGGETILDSETIPVLDSSSDTILIDLSQDSAIIVTDVDNVPLSYSNAKTTPRVYQGATELVNAQIKITVPVGATVTYDSQVYVSETVVTAGKQLAVVAIENTVTDVALAISLADDPLIKKTFMVATSRRGATGEAGQDGVSMVGTLSNDFQAIVTNNDGSGGNYSACVSTMSVFAGLVDDSANWTYEAVPSDGIQGEVSGSPSGRTYTVTNLLTDTGYIDFIASKSGYANVIKRFNITKAKTGADGTAYWLVTDISALGKTKTGTYNPSTIAISARSQAGTGGPSPYGGRFKVYDSVDSVYWTLRYTSSVDETGVNFTPSANISGVKVELYMAGGFSSLLDYEVIPVVTDGIDSKYVVVNSDKYFKYLSGHITPVSSSITLSAALYGGLSTYDWEYFNTNTSAWTNLSGTQNNSTYVLNYNAPEWGSANSIRIRCLSDGYYDEATIVKLYDGSNSYTISFSNPTHTVACYPDTTAKEGELGLTGRAICSLTVWKGATALTPVASNITPTLGEFKYIIGTPIGGTAGRVDDDTFYLNTITDDSGYIPISIYCEDVASPITQRFTFNKSIDGMTSSYVIINSEDAFVYKADQLIPNNPIITLSASLFAGLTTYTWQYWDGYSWVTFTNHIATESTYSLDYNDPAWGGEETPSLKIRCISGGYSDEKTIVKLHDGSTGLAVILTNESHTVACDSSGNAKTGELGSSGRAISTVKVWRGSTLLTAVSASSTPTIGQFKYIIGSVSGGTAGRFDDDTFYLNTITANAGEIPIDLYVEGDTLTLTKRFSFNKSIDGANGQDGASVAGTLTNDFQSVSTNNDGTGGDYSGCVTTMNIVYGIVDDSANWTYTAIPSAGITGAASNSNRTYTVYSMSTDKGYVEFTASKNGYANITKRFNIAKSKTGAIGQSYWLLTGVGSIGKSNSNTYTPPSLSIYAKSQVGTQPLALYEGRFVISETLNNIDWTVKYTSSVDESSVNYTPSSPSSNIVAVKVELFVAGGITNLVDYQIIPIVKDGTNGTNGTAEWSTYCDNALSDTPLDPPSSGTGGPDNWHTNLTASSVWISNKRAVTIDDALVSWTNTRKIDAIVIAGEYSPKYKGIYPTTNPTDSHYGDWWINSSEANRGIWSNTLGRIDKDTAPTTAMLGACWADVLLVTNDGPGVIADYIGTGINFTSELASSSGFFNELFTKTLFISSGGSIRGGSKYLASGEVDPAHPTDAGFWLGANGNLKAFNGTFTGNVTADSGAIGGWTIGATGLYYNKTAYMQESTGVYLGNDGIGLGLASTGFYVSSTGSVVAKRIRANLQECVIDNIEAGNDYTIKADTATKFLGWAEYGAGYKIAKSLQICADGRVNITFDAYFSLGTTNVKLIQKSGGVETPLINTTVGSTWTTFSLTNIPVLAGDIFIITGNVSIAGYFGARNFYIKSSTKPGILTYLGSGIDTGIVSPSPVISVANEESIDSPRYLLFSAGTSGTQELKADSGLSYNPSTNTLSLTAITTSGAVVVGGDLTVNGTTTTINTVNLSVDDNNIELGAVATPSNTTANGGGFTLKAGSDVDKTIIWDSTNKNWTSSEHWNLASTKEFKINNVSVLNATTLGASVVSSSLTSVGTVTTGTWSANTIAVNKGGTGITSVTQGGIVYGASATAYGSMSAGTVGQALLSGGTNAPTWTLGTLSIASGKSATFTNSLTVSGADKIFNGTGTGLTLAGAFGLTINIGATTSLTLPASLTLNAPTVGGILYGATNAYASTSVGTAGQALLSGGTNAPTWTAGTLSIATGKSATFTNSLTISGADKTIDGTGTGITLSGAYGLTLALSGVTTLTLPTSGTVTALGNTVTGSGSIVLANAPSITNPTISSSGAKTTNFIGITATNIATSSTASVTKIGMSLESTGTWNGTSAINRALYLNATGGTINQALYVNSGIVSIADTTASSSTSTGSLINAGGLGVGGATYLGSTLNVSGAAIFSSTINKVTITAPTNGATLTINEAKSLISNVNLTVGAVATYTGDVTLRSSDTNAVTLTLTGSPSLSGSGTATLTSNATFTTAFTVNVGNITLSAAGATATTATLPATGNITLLDLNTAQTLTNKTLSTSSVWNGNTIAVNYGGTGVTSFTAGQILFGNNTSAIATSANLFWDSANNKLGINTNTPQYGVLDVRTTASNTGGLSLYRGTGSTARHWIDSNDTYLIQRATTDTAGIAIDSTGKIGFGTITPTEKIHVVGNIKQDGNYSIFNNFVSGIFGTGWRLDYNVSVANESYLELDNITVRNTIRTHIFQKDVVKVTNGMLYVSDSIQISAVTGTTGTGTITVDDSKSASFSSFPVEMWFKDFNAAGIVKSVKFNITSLNTASNGIRTIYNVTWVSGDSLAEIPNGGVCAKTSGGGLLLDAISNNSPYMDIILNGVVKARLGNLAGISGASGYGLWSDNVFLTGDITANTGYIGGVTGWTIASNRLTTNSETNYIAGGSTAPTAFNSNGTGFYIGGTGKFRVGTVATNLLSSGIWWDGTALQIKAAHFTLDADGNLNATNATLSGEISATTGAVGGWTVDSNSIYKNNITFSSTGYVKIGDLASVTDTTGTTSGLWVDNSGNALLKGTSANYIKVTDNGSLEIKSDTFTLQASTSGSIGLTATAYGTGNGVWLSSTADARFRVGNASGARMQWTDTSPNLEFYDKDSNKLVSIGTNNTIAGWTISTTALSTGAFDTVNTMYFGTSGISLSNTFKVTSAGVLSATGATISGTITATDGYIGNDTNGWDIGANGITAKGTSIIQTSASANTGIKIDANSIRGYDGTNQRILLSADGSGWFGTSDKFSWTNTGVITLGGWTLSSSAIYNTKINISSATVGSSSGVITLSGGDAKLYIGSGISLEGATTGLLKVDSTIILDGSSTGKFTLGTLASAITATANTGIYMDGSGNFRVGTATNGTNYLYFNGTSLDIKSSSFTLQTSTTGAIGLTATSYTAGNGVWLSSTANTRFRVGNADASRMQWDDTNLEIYNSTNSKVASFGTSNTLAGWTLGSSSLYNLRSSFNSTIAGVYIGTDGIALGSAIASAEFSVTSTGVLTAKSGTVGGWTLGASSLYNGRTGLTTGASGVYLGTNGIALGDTVATPEFSVTSAGVLTAKSGTVGGWTLGTSSLYSGRTALTTGNGIYIGTDGIALGATASTPEFKVLSDGSVVATKITATLQSCSISGVTPGDKIVKQDLAEETKTVGWFGAGGGFKIIKALQIAAPGRLRVTFDGWVSTLQSQSFFKLIRGNGTEIASWTPTVANQWVSYTQDVDLNGVGDIINLGFAGYTEWFGSITVKAREFKIKINEEPGILSFLGREGDSGIIIASPLLTLVNDETTASDRFITFSSSATGSGTMYGSSQLKYNPSTNTITASIFSGALSGNASTATSLNLTGSTTGAIPYQSAANTTSYLAATATAGKALLSGANASPSWSTGTLSLDKNLAIQTGNLTLIAHSSGTIATLPSGTITLADLGTAQTFTGVKTFNNSTIKIVGSNTGTTTLTSGNASVSNYTLTLPAITGTLITTADTGTVTNTMLANSKISGVSLGGNLFSLTIKNTGDGDGTGTTYNGSAAVSISYNSIGASPLAGSTSLITTGTITTGTWSATTIAVTKGGTGLTACTKGDILYASDANTYATLGGVTAGSVLLSGTAPSWGKVGLTTHVSGILGTANGGTGANATFTSGSIIFANSSAVLAQDNANLFWDNTNKRLGIKTATPGFTLEVGGSFAATTKSFVIKHPTKEGMKLCYGSLESPYHGVRLTGKAKVKKGICVVTLPDYIYNLVQDKDVNIQISNYKHGKVLWVDSIDVEHNQFIVRTEKKLFDNKEYEFFWDFTAKRKDIPDLVVEFENP